MDCMQQKQIERRLRHILCRPNRQGKRHERHHPVQHNAQQHRTGSQGVEVVVAAVCREYRRFHCRAEETLIGAVKEINLGQGLAKVDEKIDELGLLVQLFSRQTAFFFQKCGNLGSACLGLFHIYFQFEQAADETDDSLGFFTPGRGA